MANRILQSSSRSGVSLCTPTFLLLRPPSLSRRLEDLRGSPVVSLFQKRPCFTQVPRLVCEDSESYKSSPLPNSGTRVELGNMALKNIATTTVPGRAHWQPNLLTFCKQFCTVLKTSPLYAFLLTHCLKVSVPAPSFQCLEVVNIGLEHI